MNRFFVDGNHEAGDIVELSGGDARKILLVLRLKTGAPLVVCDSGGRSFEATLEIEAETVRARLGSVLSLADEARLRVVLAQGIPKGAKMDFVVEKATELGAARILPLVTERTLGDGDRAGKIERWRRLARTAAQQSGRSEIPEIEPPLSWPALLDRFAGYDCVLVPWELAERVPLRERLPGLLRGARSVLVVIGPEGGLSHHEVDGAVGAGAKVISLGARILRTETAGLIACAALLYASGEL